jgi:putative phosphoesterase
MSPMPSTSVRIAVLADTHLAPTRRGALPPAARAELGQADVILHAGDVVTADLLDDLGRLAPVHAVLGNNDRALVGVLPDRLELEIEGVHVAMVHDAGPRKGRPARLHRWFPDADVVVFGHSHDPVNEPGVDGQLLFNPGSPTQRRRQPHHTMGVLELVDGQVARSEIVRV